MKQEIVQYLHDCFAILVDKYGFAKLVEFNDEHSYSIEYGSKTFLIRIDKYYREFYVIVSKPGASYTGVNLYNLLDYQFRNSSQKDISNYFSEEKNIDECLKKQLAYISTAIVDNFDTIHLFFNDENYAAKLQEITQFMLHTYPNLFKRR
jgi:hypothetical protein